MEGEEWLIVIILAALLLMILVSAYLGFARHNVKKTSERLNALKELNNTTEFMPVEAQYRYEAGIRGVLAPEILPPRSERKL